MKGNDQGSGTPVNPEKTAWIYVLRLLAKSPLSRKAVADKLRGKACPAGVIESVMARLEASGMISDQSAAESVLFRYGTARPSGRRRVDFEMKRRGIPPDIRRACLESYTPDEERGRALELAERRSARLKDLPLLQRKKKVFDFLLRRGFDPALARSVLQGAGFSPCEDADEIIENG